MTDIQTSDIIWTSIHTTIFSIFSQLLVPVRFQSKFLFLFHFSFSLQFNTCFTKMNAVNSHFCY